LSKREVYGNYVNLSNLSKTITLSNSGFTFRDTILNLNFKSIGDCCDTIAYGSWEMISKNHLLVLNSAEELGSQSFNKIKFNVIEYENLLDDSLVIEINNPLEKENLGDDYEKVLDYELMVIKKSENFIFQESNKNIIVFSKFDEPLKEIKCYIYVNHKFRGRNMGVRPIEIIYFVKSAKANKFIINIPDLTYQYLTYLRFNREFIRVIDKDHLEWQGEIYVKKKKGA
jgi:hypothetical protein